MANDVINENEGVKDDDKINQTNDIKNENQAPAEKTTNLTEGDIKRMIDIAIGEFANKLNVNSNIDQQDMVDDGVKPDINTDW